MNNSDQWSLHINVFVNENAVKAKASGAPPLTPLGELSALP